MRQFRTAVIVALTTMILLGLAYATAFAETGQVTWSVSGNTLTIKGTGEMDDYEERCTPWYRDRDKITKVVIKSGVTSIGNYAFSDLSNLTSITIGENITRIGDFAFRSCIGLTGVSLPQSVTSIGTSAFSGCFGLTDINISQNVSSIGENAFQSCNVLTGIQVDSGNTHYSSVDGVVFDKNQTQLIVYPSGKSGSYDIPEGVQSISSHILFL